MTQPFDSLADRLEAIADELADVAMVELSSAIRRGEQKRPAAERALTQSRRAVEKAVHLLRHIADDADGNADGIKGGSDQFD